ncbi:MAG: ABC transporter ATP-binding protein [Betaproteobacteria bacterium]|nr:ABC transporter ATP-binding protein [Betaproteobacteria bacterium]
MSALVIENLSKHFGGVAAVSGVSMEAPPGRVTGLIGPNGAGKTTLINLITGVLTVSDGRIHFGGQDITQVSAHLVARSGVARTFQNIRLLAEASVIDNVMIGFYRNEKTSTLASLLGLPSARRETAALRSRANALLERFGMSQYANHEAGGLAYGHQRRVEMMRALASEPRLILLDEPVAGMNDVEAGELGEIFRGLARSGMSVLLIEHNIRFVTNICEYIYVLDSGRMIASGTPEQIVNDPAVITAYLGS